MTGNDKNKERWLDNKKWVLEYITVRININGMCDIDESDMNNCNCLVRIRQMGIN